MERFGIKKSPPVTPAEIDPSEYSSLKALIDGSCEQFATHTAFIQMEQHLSYEELDQLSNRFPAWLQRNGLKKGDRVAIMLPKILQHPVVIFVLLRASMTVVHTTPLYTAHWL